MCCEEDNFEVLLKGQLDGHAVRQEKTERASLTGTNSTCLYNVCRDFPFSRAMLFIEPAL